MIYNYTAIMTLITSLLLAFFILVKNPKKESNIVLSMLGFITFIWTFILFIVRYLTDNNDIVLFLTKINFVVMIFCSYLLFHFVEIFPNDSIKNKKYLLYCFIPVPIVWILLATPYIITNARVVSDRVDVDRGMFYAVYVIIFISYLLMTIVRLYLKFKAGKGLLRLQTKYILWAFGIMFTGASITNLVLPLFQINSFVQYGPFFTIPFMFLDTLPETPALLRAGMNGSP